MSGHRGLALRPEGGERTAVYRCGGLSQERGPRGDLGERVLTHWSQVTNKEGEPPGWRNPP